MSPSFLSLLPYLGLREIVEERPGLVRGKCWVHRELLERLMTISDVIKRHQGSLSLCLTLQARPIRTSSAFSSSKKILYKKRYGRSISTEEEKKEEAIRNRDPLLVSILFVFLFISSHVRSSLFFSVFYVSLSRSFSLFLFLRFFLSLFLSLILSCSLPSSLSQSLLTQRSLLCKRRLRPRCLRDGHMQRHSHPT